ncbi:galactofuranose ABC transporter, permease protein YjfF [Actomonas aquatica]|uniref:Galactofuranose ABC transporter, permease protein YjfF n=1 Tax=Actomonas aquatica TaxID=2866162 RepID=A0ABZ1CEZ1_9BACT|nr:galactofuranose ABC transporter, permease protein YjfF [Opitutus sp. WL0086]WRQ90016.1 galactofuranose ABC transporter, permease protein YjfF [Opitutus sp. WL0086]
MKSLFRSNLPVCMTAIVLLALYLTGGFLYDGFFSGRVVANLFADNAFLGIAALGMTLVIFTGGIDLSVGSVIGFTSILTATLIGTHGWAPFPAWIVALAAGTALGLLMGALVERCELPPFLVTLAGMFFARGLGFAISTESVPIEHELYRSLSDIYVPLGFMNLPFGGLVFVVMVGLIYVVAHHTRFGRNLLAIGSNEASARLMGLPVSRTKIAAYALNGGLAAAAGIVATLYTGSGNPATGVGLELDAIAVVVIGGTLLAGGRGHILGTLLGVLIFSVIQTGILFDGRLNSSWMRIVVGLLLLVFILLQRLLLAKRKTG